MGKVLDTALDVLLRIVIAGVVTFVGLFLIRRAKSVTEKVLLTATKVHPAVATFTSSIVAFLLKYFLMTIVLGLLGVDPNTFAAAITAFTLAIALSLDESVSNFAAGLMLLMFEQYVIGDIVEIAGETGTVAEIQLYCTVLITACGKTVYVTNGEALGNNIVNLTCRGERETRLNLPVGIAYTDSIHEARAVLLKILHDDPRVLKTPAPQVVVSELGDNSVNLLMRPWVNGLAVGQEAARRIFPDSRADIPRDLIVNMSVYWSVGASLLEKGKNALDEAGISIPFPQEDWHLNLVTGFKSPPSYPRWVSFDDREGGASLFFRRPQADKRDPDDEDGSSNGGSRLSFGSAKSALSSARSGLANMFGRKKKNKNKSKAKKTDQPQPDDNASTVELADAGQSSSATEMSGSERSRTARLRSVVRRSGETMK